MALPLPVPFINGHYWSFASIEIRVVTPAGLVSITDCAGINYSSSLEPGKVYGTAAHKIGRTKGRQDAEGSLEIYTRAWEQLRTALTPGGIGYGEMSFTILVSYGELGVPVKTDTLVGCRITKMDNNNAEGTDASKVTLTLDIMRVLEGGTGSIVAADTRVGL